MDEVGDGLDLIMWIGILAYLAVIDVLLIGMLIVQVAGLAGGGG